MAVTSVLYGTEIWNITRDKSRLQTAETTIGTRNIQEMQASETNWIPTVWMERSKNTDTNG